jgi:hypothetical protein
MDNDETKAALESVTSDLAYYKKLAEDLQKKVPPTMEIAVDRLYGVLSFLKNTNFKEEAETINQATNMIEQARSKLIVKSDNTTA